MRDLWHLCPPTARHHDLTTEMKFEEELIQQRQELGIMKDLHCDWYLHRRSVNIEFETDKVFRCGDLSDDPQGRVMSCWVRGDGSIEEMINVKIALWNMIPEVIWFQQSDFPAKDFIEDIA
jgi:hypothetical protein